MPFTNTGLHFYVRECIDSRPSCVFRVYTPRDMKMDFNFRELTIVDSYCYNTREVRQPSNASTSLPVCIMFSTIFRSLNFIFMSQGVCGLLFITPSGKCYNTSLLPLMIFPIWAKRAESSADEFCSPLHRRIICYMSRLYFSSTDTAKSH